MPQDFKSFFGLGNDDKSVSTIDTPGLTLAAIKELIIQNEHLRKEIEDLRQKLERKTD